MRTGMLLTYFIFFYSQTLPAQNFSPKIEAARMTIEGVSREGFSTKFDQSANVIEKSWWKYSREFGQPLNMKSYYQVTIPSSQNSGTVDLMLLSKTMGTGADCSFFLTLKDDHLPAERKPQYLDQVKLIVQDFKKYYYIGLLEEQIEALERSAKNLSKEVEKGDRPMEALMKEEQKLETLHKRLESIYLTWE